MSLYIVEVEGELPDKGYLSKARKIDVSVSEALNILYERYEFGKEHYAAECPEYVAALKVAIEAVEYRFLHEGKEEKEQGCGNCKHLYAKMVADACDSAKEYFCDEGSCLPWEKCDKWEERGENDRNYRL